MKAKKFLPLFLIALSLGTLRAQERTVETSDGVRLCVKTAGNGPACLYMHGGPGSGSLWLERFYGDFLERHFRMVYLDQRGVGRSSSPADGNYSMERMALDFEEVRQALGVERWLTLGHSFGGILQMGYAERYPASQLGLIMINCTLDLQDSFLNGWRIGSCMLLGDEGKAIWADESVPLPERLNAAAGRLIEKGLKWRLAYGSQQNERRMDSTYMEIPGFNNDFSAAAMATADYWKDYRPASAGISLPVLFFYGTKDWCIGPEHYKGVRFPQMLLYRSRGGHMPFLENQADLNRALCRYMKKYGFGICRHR